MFHLTVNLTSFMFPTRFYNTSTRKARVMADISDGFSFRSSTSEKPPLFPTKNVKNEIRWNEILRSGFMKLDLKMIWEIRFKWVYRFFSDNLRMCFNSNSVFPQFWAAHLPVLVQALELSMCHVLPRQGIDVRQLQFARFLWRQVMSQKRIYKEAMSKPYFVP